MGCACSAYGERVGVYRVLVGYLRERAHLGDPDVDRRKLLNGSSGSGCGDMDWIELAQDKDRWRKLVNALMKLRVS